MLFPLVLRGRGPYKKRACLLEGVAWNFSWLAPLGLGQRLSSSYGFSCQGSRGSFKKGQGYSRQRNPKDPAVLKILCVVNLLRIVFLVRRCDLLSRRTLCGHHLPGNYRHFPSPRRVRVVVNLGGVVKTLRHSNSLFCYRRSTVRFKVITGSLVILENLFPENYRYRYRLDIRMNYHYRYRLGPRSRPFISVDSQLPSRKSFELISSKLPLPLPS